MLTLDEILETREKVMFNALLDYRLTVMTDVDDIQELYEQLLYKICHNSLMYEVVPHLKDNSIAMIKRLLERGANIDGDCFDLCFAVESGSYYLAEILCSLGADLKNYYLRNESTPLSIAAKNGRRDIIELLLRYKVNINPFQFSGCALDCAFRHNNSECAQFLMQHGAKLDLKQALISAIDHQVINYFNFVLELEGSHEIFEDTIYLRELLILAVRRENLQIIHRIIDAGAIVNPLRNIEVIPLVESKTAEVAKLLLQRGANVHQIANTRYGRIMPLLHVLINRKSYDTSTVEIVQVLLQNGASVCEKDNCDRTPLMIAASVDGNENMLEVLLHHGADCCDVDKQDQTALMYAVFNGCTKNVAFLLHSTQNKDQFINLQNNSGLTALMFDVMRDFYVTQMLIDNGADVTIVDKRGSNALLYTMFNVRCSGSFLKVLTKAGSDVNWQNNDGFSPLMIAAGICMSDAVSIFIESGADVNVVSKTDTSKTAISFIRNIPFLETEKMLCIEALLDGGASSLYMRHEILPDIIIGCKTEFISKLIKSGTVPIDMSLCDTPFRYVTINTLSVISPLCLSLLVGNVGLARYFVEKLFLTKSDVSSIATNKELRSYFDLSNKRECLNFLDEFGKKQFSLFQLSLVSVSTAVGSSPGREERVDMLPLPSRLKDALLFKY